MALQVKRSTEATRLESTIILESGQPLYTIDSNELFMGDGSTPVKDLKGTQIGLPLEADLGTNGINQVNEKGVNSSGKIITTQSKASGNTATALGIATKAVGDGSFTSGYSSGAYTKADAAFNSAAQAGLTESEWNSNYPDNDHKYIDGTTITDYSYNDPRLVWGAFAANQSKAKGRFSAAFGSGEAWGREAFASGSKSKANGDYSFSGGISCQATSNGSIALGRESIASGDCSVAIGQTNQASGDRSIALGQGNICSSLLGVAIGENNNVSSKNGIALGLANTVVGAAAFSAGSNNESRGYASATLGKLLIADTDKQTVVGLLNNPLGSGSKAYFVVGNGDDGTGDRSNAFVVFGDKAAKSYLEPKEDNDILRWQEKVELENRIENEENKRQSADARLDTLVQDAVGAQEARDTQLQNLIESETDRATAAELELNESITTKEDQLDSKIEAETSERQTQDNILQTNISNVDNKFTDGSTEARFKSLDVNDITISGENTNIYSGYTICGITENSTESEVKTFTYADDTKAAWSIPQYFYFDKPYDKALICFAICDSNGNNADSYTTSICSHAAHELKFFNIYSSEYYFTLAIKPFNDADNQGFSVSIKWIGNYPDGDLGMKLLSTTLIK